MTHPASDQPTDPTTAGDAVNTPHPDTTGEFMNTPVDTDAAPPVNGGNVVQLRPDSATTAEDLPAQRAAVVAEPDEVIDAELVDDPEPPAPAVPVDPADPATTSKWQAAREAAVKPVVPQWARSRDEVVSRMRWALGYAGHTAAFHVVRTPLYSAKLAARAPRGACRTVASTYRWVYDAEAKPLRLAAVQAGEAKEYRELAEIRAERIRKRMTTVFVVLLIAGAGVYLLSEYGSALLCWLTALATLGVLGAIGTSADKPVAGRAVVMDKVAKLTSEAVVTALGALGVGQLNQALAKGTGVTFPKPIVRDGPGWRADVDLPHGVTVGDVIERRKRLASALRRPLGCVWPEPDAGVHEGRLVLWVGDQDMSSAKPAKWPLAKTGQVDLFKPQPFGTDQRGRMVNLTLMFTSAVVGSIPRMGKTFTEREMLLIAALDPRAELHVYDLKGTGDLSVFEPVAHAYGVGDEEDAIEAQLTSMRSLRQELRRRTKVIRELPRDLCPENKVTPELASKKSLKLHPIVIGVDECQVWFEHPDHGAEFEEICTDLVKRGPALGFTFILATQRPDSKSIPTGISANVSTRFCMKVMGQTENDMVLGTSQYKNGVRATMFSWNDKGIGYLIGEGADARIVRTFYIDAPAAETIVVRARAMREAAGRITGHAAGERVEVEAVARVSIVADVTAVTRPEEAKVWSETIVDRLAELRPDIYAEWAAQDPRAKANQLSAALKPFGIETQQVYGKTAEGKPANRRGIVRDDVIDANNRITEKHSE
jgi:S-DNA-T family DNA segregation ATPase FtsK/SpoIIIE